MKYSDDPVKGERPSVPQDFSNEIELSPAERIPGNRDLIDSIINCLPGVFYVHDESGQYLRWNKNFEMISGFSPEEIPHLRPMDFFEEGERTEVLAAIQKVFDDGFAEIETEITRKNGKKMPFYLNGYSIHYDGRRCLLGSGIDLSAREKARKGMKASEKKYRSLFQQASDAIMITDFSGKFTDVNKSFCHLFGYGRKELLRMNISELIEPNQLRERPIQMETLKKGIQTFSERYMIHKDGSLVVVEANAKKFGKNRVMAIARDVTAVRALTRRMERDMMAQKEQEQKKITRAVIRAQEKERNKIGQELHDNVNQLLASTRIYLSMVRNSDPHRMELITKSIEFIDTAVQEIRLLSKKHVTPLKTIQLQQLTQCLIDTLHENAGIKILFDYQLPDSLEPQDDLKLNIYRVIQEQLTNICKHASATNVEIRIGAEAGHIFIHIADDGKGFEVDMNRKGVGISNIINRVESYNGSVSIESQPGKGCRLDVRIPIVFPDGNFQ